MNCPVTEQLGEVLVKSADEDRLKASLKALGAAIGGGVAGAALGGLLAKPLVESVIKKETAYAKELADKMLRDFDANASRFREYIKQHVGYFPTGLEYDLAARRLKTESALDAYNALKNFRIARGIRLGQAIGGIGGFGTAGLASAILTSRKSDKSSKSKTENLTKRSDEKPAKPGASAGARAGSALGTLYLASAGGLAGSLLGDMVGSLTHGAAMRGFKPSDALSARQERIAQLLSEVFPKSFNPHISIKEDTIKQLLTAVKANRTAIDLENLRYKLNRLSRFRRIGGLAGIGLGGLLGLNIARKEDKSGPVPKKSRGKMFEKTVTVLEPASAGLATGALVGDLAHGAFGGRGRTGLLVGGMTGLGLGALAGLSLLKRQERYRKMREAARRRALARGVSIKRST